MSFVSRDDVLNITESMMQTVFKETLNINLPEHFTRLAYDDAIALYGTDKPDLVTRSEVIRRALAQFTA